MQKAERERRKRREPRRLPFSVADFMMPWEKYAPLLDSLERKAQTVNVYDGVPLGVLQEIRAGLDAGDLPGWFFSTLPDIPALKALTEGDDRSEAERE